MLPNMLHATHTELHGTTDALTLSRFISWLMLVMYFAYLVFQVRGALSLACRLCFSIGID